MDNIDGSDCTHIIGWFSLFSPASQTHLSYALIFVPLHFVILSTVHSLLMHICHGLVQYIVFKLKGFHARMDLYHLMLDNTFLTENVLKV